MQPIAPVTNNQLLSSEQQPKVKVEIYVAAAWVNLCNLDSTNYVEDWSISQGGASMTPNPIGGKFNVTLSNEDSIFHPDHPTSAYADYLVTGRLTRISIGAKYGGTDYYWQRIIGYMDVPKFDSSNFKVTIIGQDYMKLLEDTELKNPDNYWGSSATFDSIASDGIVGSEIYAEADAMEIGGGEANNVANWVATLCTFVSLTDGGGGSTYVGRLTTTGVVVNYVINTNVGSATAGKEYRFQLKHRLVGGDGSTGIIVQVYQSSGRCRHVTLFPTDDWTTQNVFFTALDTGAVEIRIYGPYLDSADYRLDQFSIKEFIPYWNRYYQLPGASKGAYYVTLDGNPVWQGERDKGWYYVEDAEAGPDPPAHPAKIVFFDHNKEVANGSSNLVVYYFTTQALEDVVADLLVTAGLYADRATALADMDYIDPAVDIDQVYFKAGTSVLNAIKKICERCDYRFYFSYEGKPVFKPKPTPGATDFAFTEQKHIASALTYQDKNEIKNRIVIKGQKQAEPISREEAMPSELKGEASDPTSIDDYGERTLTINNHLFQDQSSIDTMKASLLAEYKDPKLYANVKVPFNPVPLEFADDISWKERLSPVLEITPTGIIRDIKINGFETIYKCEKTT